MPRLMPVILVALAAGCAAGAPHPVAAPQSLVAPRPAPVPQTVLAVPGACDSNRSAETILMVQKAEAALLSAAAADPAFGSAWYEHVPCYRLVLAFTDGQPRPELLAHVPTQVRPYIAFSTSRYTAVEREQARHEITAALAKAGVRMTYFMVSTRPEHLEVGVRTEADAVIARSSVPARYRAHTIVRVGELRMTPER